MNERYKSNYNSDDYNRSDVYEDEDIEEESDCNKMTFKELISDLEDKIHKNDVLNKEVENMIISNKNNQEDKNNQEVNFLNTLDNFKNIDNEIFEQNFASRKQETKEKEVVIIPNSTENKFRTFSNLENNPLNQKDYMQKYLSSLGKNDDEFINIENSLKNLKKKQNMNKEKNEIAKKINTKKDQRIEKNQFLLEIEKLREDNKNLKNQNNYYQQKIKNFEEEKFLQDNNILNLKEKVLKLEEKLIQYKKSKKKTTKKKRVKNIYEKIQNNYELDKYSQIHKKNYKSFK